VRAGVELPQVMATHAVELGTLPRRPAELVGRASELKDIIVLLNRTRFVTVVGSASPVSSLVAYLRDKKVLLIFDSCERVPDAAAILVEQLLDGRV